MGWTRLAAFSAFLILVAACGDKAPMRMGNAGNGAAGKSGSGGTAGTTGGSGGKSGTGGGSGVGSTAGDGAAGAAGTGMVGLGDFDAGTSDTRNMVMPGTICERLSTIQCAGEVACCTNPGRTYEQCKNDMSTGCRDVLHLDEIAGNQITGFDAVAAKTAFDQFEAMASSCDPTVAAWGATETGLRGILKGTVVPGESCTVKINNTEAEAAAALASCTDLANTACMFTSFGGTSVPINWKCAAKAGVGAACLTDVNCTAGLMCNNPQAKFNAKCEARRPAGAACVNANECDSLQCKKKVCAAVGDVQAAYCLKND